MNLKNEIQFRPFIYGLINYTDVHIIIAFKLTLRIALLVTIATRITQTQLYKGEDNTLYILMFCICLLFVILELHKHHNNNNINIAITMISRDITCQWRCIIWTAITLQDSLRANTGAVRLHCAEWSGSAVEICGGQTSKMIYRQINNIKYLINQQKCNCDILNIFLWSYK